MNEQHENMKLAAKKIAKERNTSWSLRTPRENPDAYELKFGDGYEPSVEELKTKTAVAITENQWAEVRLTRDTKLRNCDWTQGADSPLTNAQKTKWRTYRQALRDITTQDDPEKIDWPTPPA